MKVVQKWDMPFSVWRAVPSRPPAVLLTPFWKPPRFYSAYAPEYPLPNSIWRALNSVAFNANVWTSSQHNSLVSRTNIP